jgi:hypothetical protein
MYTAGCCKVTPIIVSFTFFNTTSVTTSTWHSVAVLASIGWMYLGALDRLCTEMPCQRPSISSQFHVARNFCFPIAILLAALCNPARALLFFIILSFTNPKTFPASWDHCLTNRVIGLLPHMLGDTIAQGLSPAVQCVSKSI